MDELLEDLDDLSGDETDIYKKVGGDKRKYEDSKERNEDLMNGSEEDDNVDDDDDDDIDNNHDEIETGDIDSNLVNVITAKLSSQIGQLRNSNSYKSNFNLIVDSFTKSIDDIQITGNLEDSKEYQLIVMCNKIILSIEDEINSTHRYIADMYSKKISELENLIPSPIDYVKTVQRIGNKMDLTEIELSDILSSATVMIISVTGSTTSGKPLSDGDIASCFSACDEVLGLECDKKTILDYIESRMMIITPNICCLIGAKLSAQLVGIAGGLISLSRIPACNLITLGKEKRNISGIPSATFNKHAGVLQYSEIAQSTPRNLQKKALKLIASKVSLLARIDSYKNLPDGSEGLKMKKEVIDKIKKWIEPDKARVKKALPIPEEKKRNKRGGKRVQKRKEKYGQTELMKQANKLAMTGGNDEYGDSVMGLTVGMVNSRDTGKIRATKVKESKLFAKNVHKKVVKIGGSSGGSSGMASSLVFNSNQGMELVNPNASKDRVAEANKKWFATNSGFASALPKMV